MLTKTKKKRRERKTLGAQAKEASAELRKNKRKMKKKRYTRLVRVGAETHRQAVKVARERDMPISRLLDEIFLSAMTRPNKRRKNEKKRRKYKERKRKRGF